MAQAYIRCRACDQFIRKNSHRCPHCGTDQRPPAQYFYSGVSSPPPMRPPVLMVSRSAYRRDRGIAIFLAVLLGGLGAHKFYLGHLTIGVAYALFCWTFIPALISLLDILSLLLMSDDDFDLTFNFR